MTDNSRPDLSPEGIAARRDGPGWRPSRSLVLVGLLVVVVGAALVYASTTGGDDEHHSSGLECQEISLRIEGADDEVEAPIEPAAAPLGAPEPTGEEAGLMAGPVSGSRFDV